MFESSAYYIPYEGDPAWAGGTKVPIPAEDWVVETYGVHYLSENEGRYNDNDDPNKAHYASETFLYDSVSVCQQGSGKLETGACISCVADTRQWTGVATGPIRDAIKFDWAPTGRIQSLKPLETVAVCPGGPIPHPTLDINGNLQGEIPTIKLVGAGIEKFFTDRGKDNIVEVVDVGEGLCSPGHNKDSIDLYIGEGADNYTSHYFAAVDAGDITAYLKR